MSIDSPGASAPQPPIVGTAFLPTADLPPSDEALQLLLTKDPHSLTNGDIDALVLVERKRRRLIAEGLLKKGRAKKPDIS